MRRRLLLSYLAVALLVLVLLAIPLARSYADNERQALADRVERDAVAMASLVEDSLEHKTPVSAQVRRVAKNYDSSTGGRVIAVNARGRSIVDSGAKRGRDFSSRPEIARALGGTISTGTRHSNTLGTDLLFAAVPVASSGKVYGAVRITYPTSAVDARIRRYRSILAGIAGIVLAVSALVAFVLARWVGQPLERLEEAAGAIAEGDLARRAPIEGPPEVRRLAGEFNAMVGKLDALVRSQDAFVADASHQLRTPLAALLLHLENLERDVAEPGKPGLASALGEVERLSGLVDGLLVLARADRAPSATERIELAPLVDERLAAWSAFADERGVHLTSQLPTPLAALATPGRLEQILDNLLANALEVSPAGTTIAVSGRAAPPWVELHVIDQGPGMSDQQRARAFDRFWRGQEHHAEGFGLGLAIVQRLVVADGGEITLEGTPDGGLDVIVRLRPSTV